MTAVDTLNECQQAGVTLGIDDQGGLTVRGGRDAIARLVPAIRAHKPELLHLLTSQPQLVVSIVRTSQGRYSVDMEVDEKPEQIAEALPKLAVVHYRLKNGEGAGTILDPDGIQSALETLRRQYGDRLESTTYVGRYSAQDAPDSPANTKVTNRSNL